MSGQNNRDPGVPVKNMTAGPSRSPHSVKASVRPSASLIDRSVTGSNIRSSALLAEHRPSRPRSSGDVGMAPAVGLEPTTKRLTAAGLRVLDEHGIDRCESG